MEKGMRVVSVGFARLLGSGIKGSNTFDFRQGCPAFRRIRIDIRHNPEIGREIFPARSVNEIV
jgi:hypothetical protein